MEIDLEQPSGECHKEDNRLNVNVNMVGGGRGVNDKDENVANCSNAFANEKRHAGAIVSGGVFDGRHKEHVEDGINLNFIQSLEPHEGMEFESKEEAFAFYKEYAKFVGFATITKASRRSRISGKFIDAKFVCTRYGTKRETSTIEMAEPVSNADGANIPVKKKRGRINRSWSKTDCKACMHVKRRPQDGRWVVRSFIKVHNHEILPEQAYYFLGHRHLDLGNNSHDALHAIRARNKKMYASMSRHTGGCKKQENQKGNVKNKSDSTQQLTLEEGDAQFMFDHFICMQDENPNFFYAIDLNEEQRLRNVLWVDAKCRIDYGNFSDVVFFDTTYVKNEYKLPFALFVGVNHHLQFLLLGCALIADETKLTYTWLMRAWLSAMGGCAPRVILTDYDKALKEAIEEVFPGSCNCFCLWHIFGRIPEKLSYVIRQHENFLSKFNKCIFRSWTTEQFEKRWWKMVERFNLRTDVWIQSLYEDRQRWIPVYMNDNFLAGMSTIQRSESISCYFDKYIQRKTTLKEFLEQHKAILQETFEEEAKADFETSHKQPVLKTPSPFGKQMATMYTHAIFKKFQVEVLGVVACHPRIESEDGETKTFKVQDFEENDYRIVVWNETTSYLSCSCRLFEFSGFLCRHVLIVLQISGMHNIPTRYILKRWTKDAKSRQNMREQSDVGEPRVQCYNDLCQLAFRLGDVGSLSQESYNIAVNALEEALRKCETVNNTIQSLIEEVNEDNGAKKASEKNSVSRKKQVHPEVEIITVGMHDSWQQMLNSRDPTFDGYQTFVQEMGQMSSIASNHNDYYGIQQNMHRLGQLNAVTPEAQYIMQQRMQGMDHSTAGTSQLHGMASKHLHRKHLPQ